jgi:hypothetical protein
VHNKNSHTKRTYSNMQGQTTAMFPTADLLHPQAVAAAAQAMLNMLSGRNNKNAANNNTALGHS